MRITIVSWGSDGDVLPYIALALGLKRAGHQVQLATLAEYQEVVTNFGVECIPMRWNFPSPTWLEKIFKFRRPLTTINLGYQQLKNGLLDELWRVCQEAEAIIFNPFSYPCFYIAEKLGIPCYAASVQAYHHTRVFPNAWVTNGKPLGSIYNWLSYTYFNQVHWQFMRGPINQWRQKILNLPSLPVWEGVMPQIQRQKTPILYCYSSSFLPKPSEWKDDNIHITGYWFLDTHDNWQAPTDLINFLSVGSPPIYISKLWNSKKLGRKILLKVLETTGQRLIVQCLDDDYLDDPSLKDKLFYIKGFIPHKWLFTKVAAVVHHGGGGATMSCLRAGVPSIAIPVQGDNDDLFWTLQVGQSGLGIPLILQRKQLLNEELPVEDLAAAIQVAISDQAMHTRLAEMSKRIQAEDGVMHAVEAFHRHLPVSKKSELSTF
ncbi:glycosyl transferase, UDP-glucuronosyltransferase [Cylindrospermum stagnale PCC 7417]|uniref:Glycosyl transferase, UDP-glucuronosyltransferase n=2 Tax=Cylindrospermum stagnale TaxID=142864 RepID=K9WTU2_9NOST|nr:glycosyl transferase, UDP-glucuronosyltransferase [Cylindrospermum stagnale PCC 7417]